MFRLMVFVVFLITFSDLVRAQRLTLKISMDGLHSKPRSRELIFEDEKKVFEKTGKKKEELLWNFFSILYRDVQKYDLLNNEDKKLAKTFTTCNEVIKLEISNSQKKKTFEICDSPKQKGKIAEKIIKWKDFLLN